MKPLFKWVGGKRDLLPYIHKLLPEFHDYYEAFFGGGAIFFSLCDFVQGDRQWVVNDINSELMHAYYMIANHPAKVNKALERLDSMHSEKFFYRVRDKFNKLNIEEKPVTKAAMFLYLITKCFRGLWRVNRKGEFNCPIQRPDHKDRKVPSKHQIYHMSLTIQGTELQLCNMDYVDFLESIDVKEGDLVVMDPPYIPLSATSDFTSYTSEGFDFENQSKLAKIFADLGTKGAYCMAFNNDLPVVYGLYEGAKFHKIPLKRRISAKKGTGQSLTHELIITNW